MFPCGPSAGDLVGLDWWCPGAGQDGSWCSNPTTKYGTGGLVEGVANSTNSVITITAPGTIMVSAAVTTSTVTVTSTNTSQHSQVSAPDLASYVPRDVAIGVGSGLGIALLVSTGALMALLQKERKKRMAVEEARAELQDRTPQMVQSMQQMDSTSSGLHKGTPVADAAELSGHGRRGELP
ncbi:hypothetical protein B0A48_13699 [Cryoendolithus antarcticus]|uniref:Uncharacterized protein n=1 Tax=Cryoendolithus antarcticus TaxID=1507870 RepID=A0A1V8SN94_9PEZI|nr:hypothetical protein B0A48_13699 [Cryoendolithus antarcticus]